MTHSNCPGASPGAPDGKGQAGRGEVTMDWNHAFERDRGERARRVRARDIEAVDSGSPPQRSRWKTSTVASNEA